MFFKRFFKPLTEQPVAAFVHQLSDEEMQARDNNIKHFGAVVSINDSKKEDVLMIEKLKAYLAELETQKVNALAKDVTPMIDEKVAEYRAKCEAEAKAELEALVAKLDSDIDCINKLIAREEELAAAAITSETE